MSFDPIQLAASAVVGAVSFFASKLFDRETARVDSRLKVLEDEVKTLRENDATHAARIASVQESVTRLSHSFESFVSEISKKIEQLLISSAKVEGALSMQRKDGSK